MPLDAAHLHRTASIATRSAPGGVAGLAQARIRRSNVLHPVLVLVGSFAQEPQSPVVMTGVFQQPAAATAGAAAVPALLWRLGQELG
jgi:hypothetical protein